MKFLFALVLWAFGPGSASAAEPPSIAAAADLQFVLPAIAGAFTRETGNAVKLAFGASGNLRRQIVEGAPYELFLSADEDYPKALAREGRTRDEGTLYAVGRLALVAPPGSPVAIEQGMEGLRQAIAAGQVKRFAIANPAFAPYGRAAQQALTSAGLWEALQPMLVTGENVAQAAQFALTPGVQAGIVSYAQAQSPALARRIRSAPVPADLHAPLRQRMVLIKGAGETATAFYLFLQGPIARGLLAAHGFAVPHE